MLKPCMFHTDSETHTEMKTLAAQQEVTVKLFLNTAIKRLIDDIKKGRVELHPLDT